MARLLRYVAALALLGLVAWLINWHELGATLRGVKLIWVVLAGAACLAERLIMNLKWQLLLRARGVGESFWSLLRIQLAANLFGAVMPSSIGVDALRATALFRRGDHKHSAIAATLVDRVTTVACTIVLGCVMVFVVSKQVVGTEVTLAVAFLGLGVAIAVAVALHGPSRRTLRQLMTRFVPARFAATLHQVIDALEFYRRSARVLATGVVITAFAFAARILFGKCLLLACGLDIPAIDLLLVLPIVWIAVMLPITIGGIGLQETAYIGLLSIIGVNASIAVAVSLLEHVVVRLVVLPGALFWADVAPKAALFGNAPPASPTAATAAGAPKPSSPTSDG